MDLETLMTPNPIKEAAPAAAGMDGAGGGGYPPGHPYAAYGAYGGADQQQQQLQQQQQQQQQPPPPQPQQAQQQLYGNAEAGGYVDPSQAQLYQQQLYQQQAAAAAFGQQGGQQMTQEQMQWLLQQQQLQQQQHQHQLYQQQQAQQQAQQQQLLQQYALQQQQLYQQQQAAQQAQQQAAAQQAAAAMAAHQQQQQAQQQLQQQQQQQAVPGQEQMTPQQQHELQQRQWALQQLQMQQQQQARTEEERRRRAEMQQRQEEALEEMQKQKELDAAAAAQAAAALAAAPVEGEQAAFGQDGAAAAGGLAVAGGVVVYCVCQRTEEECDGGLMIECADGKHGCNGWFHPECEGLMLTEEELEKGSFTCSLCKSGGKARGAGRGRGRGRGPGGRGRGGKRKSGSDEEDGPGEQLIETVTSRGRVRKAKAINFGESDDDGGDEEDDYSDDGRGGGAAVRAARKSAAAFAAQQPGFGTIIGPPPPVNAPFDFTVEKILSWQPYDEEDAEGKEREYRLTGKDFWLVKWKGRSFLHTSWETRDGLLLHDGATDTKIKRYETAMQKVRGPLWREQLLEEMKERKGPELPDAELTEVQRVLSCETAFAPIAAVARQVRRQRHALWLDEQAEAGADPEQAAAAAAAALEQAQASRSQLEQEEDAAHDQVRYLVKWRGLSYHEATWEKWADIKEWAYEEVAQFWLVQRPEAKLNREQGSAWGAANVQALQDMSNPKFGFRTRSFLSVYDPYGPSDLNQTEADGGPLELRDYQLTGLKWLMFNCIQRRPSILADEMGLGKTIQTMAFLTQLYHTPGGAQRGPFLVVAPLSLVTQWQAEAQTWAPDLNVLVYHGNTEARQVIRDYEFYFCEPYIAAADAHYLKQHSIVKFDILLTTYETVIKDIKFLQQIHWKCLVVDEAHRLKNPSSRLFTELRQLPRGHTVLLTGTPLQNKTEELWALLNFADPVAFADQAAFLQQYGELKEAAQVESLHNMLKPFLLRRIKEDVEKSLPPKEETVVEVSLTPLQRKFYMAIYDRNTAFLFKESKPSMAPSLMNVMMELRKCCNHAYLNRGVEERILSEIPPEQRTPETLHTQLVACSGKLVLLDKLLPRLKTEGHKVLIFSQMVRVLDLVEDYLRYQGYLYERLDGSKRASERSAAVVRFNNPALNRFIMLLSTRAGGLGLNLTAADTVIIYDSDWNPHNDLQAQARAHRIGQTKAVKVYRLLTRKSYEVEMFHTASMKLGLDRAMLAHTRAEDAVGGGGDGMLKATGGKPSMELTHTEVEHLLKRGAYDVFRGDDKEGQEFQEADLDQILQRQSHNVTYEKSGAATGLGSSFAKASFVSVDKKEDIDLDDPDFWRKAIGLKEPPKETAAISKLGGTSFFGNVLAPGEKRKRKRNERFDPSGLAALAGEGFEDSPFEDDGEDDSDDESGDKSYSSGEPRRRGRPRKGELRGSAGRGGRGKRGRQPSGLGLNGATDGGPPRKPMKWGPHSRDRVIRALLEFGFGRWERIRQEGNALDATASEIESFCRSYVLQCGLCAGQGKRGKNETKFVKDAIAAASKLAAQMASGEIVLPEVLKDDKFLAKLRGGLARKALVRLDVLLRLQTPLMNEAVRLAMAGMGPAALAAKGVKPEDMAALGFEERFALLDLGEVAARLPLGDVRPTWTRITPWWDDECDKHLLVGVYAHGYLAYNAIRDDPTLCFGRKLRAWLEKHPGGVGAGAGAGAADALAALPMPKEQVLGVDATWDPLLVILRLPKRRDGRGGDGGAATGKKEAEGEASAAPASAEQAVAAIEAAEQPKQSPMSTTEEGEADGAAVKMEEDGAPSKPEPGAEAGAGADKPAAKEEQPPPPQQQSFYLRAVTFPGKRTSTFKGVYAQPGSWHWAAQVLHPAGPKCVSFCLDEEEAARAYDKEARDLFGPDAVCNFLLSGERNPALPPVKPGESPPLVWNRSSRYRGVRAAGSKWTAQCSLGGASRHLGTFATELEAALAYDLATQKNHPEGLPQAVVLNFPDGMEAELAALDARMAALTAGALPGGWASAAAAQEAAGVAAATIAQAEAEGKLDGADGPISLVPAPAAVAAVAAAAAAGVKAEAVAVKKEEEQTETAVEAPATAAEAERPPSSAATGTQTSSASTPQPPEDQEAASASASASKDEAQPPQPPAAPADEEKEQGQGVEGDASEPSPAPAASKAEAADGGVAEQKTAEGEGNGEGEAKPVPAPEQEQEQEQEQAKEGGGGSEGNLIPAASSTSLAASTAASLDVVVVEDTAEEDEDDEMMDIGGKDEEDGASSAKADGGSEAGGAAGAGAEGAGAKAASSTSTAGPKVVDELLRKHWPDNSKVLCKLVGWLIDDPEARLTLREVRAQEEERLAKRLEEERVRRELLARAKRARAEVELRRAQHQQQGGKRKESVDGGGGISLSGGSAEDLKRLRGGEKWSLDECRRLCNALLISGAPLASPPLPVATALAAAVGLGPASLKPPPAGVPLPEGVAGYLPTFTWNDLTQRAGLHLHPARGADEVALFYATELLPLFQRLCAHRGPLAEGETGSHIPDPSRPVSEHSQGARSIAYTFMRRQQVCRATRFILEKELPRLAELLEAQARAQAERQGQGQGQASSGLPSWWRPQQHDLALMVAGWAHGILNVEQARRWEPGFCLSDGPLRAHVAAALKEQQRQQLQAAAKDGVEVVEDAAGAVLEPDDAAIAVALAAFPERKTIEERLQRICLAISNRGPSGGGGGRHEDGGGGDGNGGGGVGRSASGEGMLGASGSSLSGLGSGAQLSLASPPSQQLLQHSNGEGSGGGGHGGGGLGGAPMMATTLPFKLSPAGTLIVNRGGMGSRLTTIAPAPSGAAGPGMVVQQMQVGFTTAGGGHVAVAVPAASAPAQQQPEVVEIVDDDDDEEGAPAPAQQQHEEEEEEAGVASAGAEIAAAAAPSSGVAVAPAAEGQQQPPPQPMEEES